MGLYDGWLDHFQSAPDIFYVNQNKRVNVALSPTAEEWIERVADEVSEFKNFSSTSSHKQALGEIFEELERYAGKGAVNQLGEEVIEVAEHGFHPTAPRARERAQNIAIREFDAELPAGSVLLKSRNG